MSTPAPRPDVERLAKLAAFTAGLSGESDRMASLCAYIFHIESEAIAAKERIARLEGERAELLDACKDIAGRFERLLTLTGTDKGTAAANVATARAAIERASRP